MRFKLGKFVFNLSIRKEIPLPPTRVGIGVEAKEELEGEVVRGSLVESDIVDTEAVEEREWRLEQMDYLRRRRNESISG